MLILRPSNERGTANHGWLDSKFSFSFSHYYDPNHMGFGPLRVINEDYIEAGQGFGMHPHDNMEIITYPISGALAHKDSMGHASTIKAGMIQKMSAGTGIRHSEFNPLAGERSHLLQIWIIPDRRNIQPNYQEYDFVNTPNALTLIASSNEAKGIAHVQQDLDLYRCELQANESIETGLRFKSGWIQMIQGSLQVNDTLLCRGDGLAIEEEASLQLKAVEDTHFLLFDLKKS